MAEYNGTIELISGLVPKNNGDFPLVQAKDVAMPDGSRLSDMTSGAYPIVDASTTEIPSIEDGTVKAISPETYYLFGEVDSLIVYPVEPNDGKMHEFCFEFIPSNNFEGFSVYGGCKWATEAQFTAGKTCQVSIMHGIGVMISA